MIMIMTITLTMMVMVKITDEHLAWECSRIEDLTKAIQNLLIVIRTMALVSKAMLGIFERHFTREIAAI